MVNIIYFLQALPSLIIKKFISLNKLFLPFYCLLGVRAVCVEIIVFVGFQLCWLVCWFCILLYLFTHVFLIFGYRYTKPWALRHKIFGHALRQRYSIDECAKLYGPYCRASWLEFITNVVHRDCDGDSAVAGSRTVDFMR